MSTIRQHVVELHQLLGGLQRCVASLAATHGDTAAVRRIANDAERIQNAADLLEIDAEAAELEYGLTAAASTAPAVSDHMMIPIPATEYHFDFWRDVDHEGIGGQTGAGARASHTRRRK